MRHADNNADHHLQLEPAGLSLERIRNTYQSCQRLPMPRMRAAAAGTDLRGIRLRNLHRLRYFPES